MGLFTYDPGPLQSFDLTNPKQLKVWQMQVAQSLSQIESIVSSLATSPAYLSNLVLGTPVDLGTITTDQTVSVNGRSSIFVRVSSAVTQARTITFTGLTQGALVFLDVNVTANTLTLKLAAASYTISAFNLVTRAIVDMVGTGFASTGPSTWFASGMSGFVATNASPRLDLMLAN